MQSFAVITLIAAFVCYSQAAESPELVEKKAQVLSACKEELKPSEESLKIISTADIPSTEEQRCLLECIYKQVGMIKDGQLNKDGASGIAKLRYGSEPEKLEKVEKIFESCKGSIVADPAEKCSLGRKVRECVFKHPDGAQLRLFGNK